MILVILLWKINLISTNLGNPIILDKELKNIQIYGQTC